MRRTIPLLQKIRREQTNIAKTLWRETKIETNLSDRGERIQRGRAFGARAGEIDEWGDFHSLSFSCHLIVFFFSLFFPSIITIQIWWFQLSIWTCIYNFTCKFMPTQVMGNYSFIWNYYIYPFIFLNNF